ncbi:MAG TPA: A/G-specific adenine glycosylase [Bacteroidales bacterium]|jgi:A/G-specific adenine glycosylase|nr:A/G-specific adenine glycosylase [Bacteroidales bacterium]
MISTLLIKWYEINKRNLPWRNTRSPYNIWLSEIILQQTRVNQGLDYYNKFVERFPSIKDLADASIDEVLKMWQGLGYYTRARNLHITAISVVEDHGGEFPSTYDQLAKLKGVGQYTAAALASFAFKQAVPLIDGNVYRVISRLFDIETSVNTSAGRRLFLRYAEDLLNKDEPDIHNQAMMEFGAIVCLPRNPGCSSCVLSAHCLALKHNTVHLRPVKKSRLQNRTRYFNYLYIICNDVTWLKKRAENDIWNSLYELPMIETPFQEEFGTLVKMDPWNQFVRSTFSLIETTAYTHKLSHQLLRCRFFLVKSDSMPDAWNDFTVIPVTELNKYAVPRVIERYWDDLRNRGIA